jgi:hypothetical protein
MGFDLVETRAENTYQVKNELAPGSYRVATVDEAKYYISHSEEYGGMELIGFLEQICQWLEKGDDTENPIEVSSVYDILAWKPWSTARTVREDKIVFELMNNVTLHREDGYAYPASLMVHLTVKAISNEVAEEQRVEAIETRRETNEDIGEFVENWNENIIPTMQRKAQKFYNITLSGETAYDYGFDDTVADSTSPQQIYRVMNGIIRWLTRHSIKGDNRLTPDDFEKIPGFGNPMSGGSSEGYDPSRHWDQMVQSHAGQGPAGLIDDTDVNHASTLRSQVTNTTTKPNVRNFPIRAQYEALDLNESASTTGNVITAESAWNMARLIIENDDDEDVEGTMTIQPDGFRVPERSSDPDYIYDVNDPLGRYFNKVRELLDSGDYEDVGWNERAPAIFWSKSAYDNREELYNISLTAMKESNRKMDLQQISGPGAEGDYREEVDETLRLSARHLTSESDMRNAIREYISRRHTEKISHQNILKKIIKIKNTIIEQGSSSGAIEDQSGGGEKLASGETIATQAGGLFWGDGEGEHLGSFLGGGNAGAVANAIDEVPRWRNDDGSQKTENDPTMKGQLDAYWTVGSTGQPYNAEVEPSHPWDDAKQWSAAFISFVFQNDDSFNHGTAHQAYMQDARDNRDSLEAGQDVSGKYVAYRPDEISQLAPGDLVCWPREGSGDGFDDVGRKNHCDIYIGNDQVIGGNLSDTVLQRGISKTTDGGYEVGNTTVRMIISKDATSLSDDG